jgi:hypothetical protein
VSDWTPVTKERFFRFIDTYPQPLDRDVAMFCEPACVNYNDFSEGKTWPQSMVAKYYQPGMGNDKPHDYAIRSDLVPGEGETAIPGAEWNVSIKVTT